MHSLEDLRRTVRMHVVDDILQMLSTVAQGRTRDDAVMAMASAYRSYAHHHPVGTLPSPACRWAATTPEFTAASHAASVPIIEVLTSYGLDGGEDAFYAALEFWAAVHGFVLLEMTGVMDTVDADVVFSDMVLRLAAGMAHRSGGRAADLLTGTDSPGHREPTPTFTR